MNIELIKADITTLSVDAIVNAANSSLLGGGGVDGAIHRKGGPAILEACMGIRDRQGGCVTGDAVITTGGNLPAKYVIHTVGPVWNGDKEEKAKLLASCYRNSLQLAIENGIKTIAFPNISTGIYHFPKEKAAVIALEAVRNFKPSDAFNRILFVCFDDENYSIYERLLKEQITAKSSRNPVKDALLGLAVGDALGVPVEFVSREALRYNPVTNMRAYGTHQQKAGTWSDDSALTFCLAEMLCGSYDLQNLANRFVKWKKYGHWSAHGRVFDIGIATSAAISELARGCNPVLAGGSDEDSNGNGSLMRILPLIFYTKKLPMPQRFEHVREVSSLTHGHIRSIIACFIYTEFAIQLLSGAAKTAALEFLHTEVSSFLDAHPDCPEAECKKFRRILHNPTDSNSFTAIEKAQETEVNSNGYVLSTLEASLWCLMTTDNYSDAVLKAVNLGSDTDTTAAVTGGLAGLLYGCESIPATWIAVLARRNDIEDLAQRLAAHSY